jgi:chloramphenicol-sensitive protein RarD
VLGEPMPAERWIGFILVWVAMAVFLGDILLHRGRGRRTAPPALV